MEILWWLVPSLAVTSAAMCWVGWLGREGRGEIDREVAVERLARALSKDRPTPAKPEARMRDRSTGIAVRPTRDASEVPPSTRRAS
ncbi:hypothetical protein [Nocardioides sp. 616]|uniref:hypothetical protein n=1 Tax=Nocardioides sp. 616 TaxID=2268090 RepID=UPI0019660A9C|nr:hypothetical protein [Nocardioides sp. 616]